LGISIEKQQHVIDILPMFRRGTKRPRFNASGHPIFEYDDSSNHSGLGITDYEEDSSSQQHTTSTNSSDPNFSFSHFTPDRPRRVQKSITKSHNEDNTNLNACIDYLLRTLSRRDKEGFFQYPVSDQVKSIFKFSFKDKILFSLHQVIPR